MTHRFRKINQQIKQRKHWERENSLKTGSECFYENRTPEIIIGFVVWKSYTKFIHFYSCY